MRAPLFVLALMLSGLAASADAAPSRGASRPVLVELFTSQGCEACVKANSLPRDLDGQGVLALTYPVDYWDYLGWTDTYARPEFTARQKAYMRPLGQRDVFTPQVVVDGRSQAAGTRADRVTALIKEAARSRARGPTLRFFAAGFVRVEGGVAPKGGAEAWLIRYDPTPAPVEVKTGENRGEDIAYANVVRELTRLGSWTGKRRTYALPKAEDPDLKTVILLQGAKGGRVLGVLER